MSDPRDRLRREIRKRRAALPASTRIAAADALAERMAELPELLTDDQRSPATGPCTASCRCTGW